MIVVVGRHRRAGRTARSGHDAVERINRRGGRPLVAAAGQVMVRHQHSFTPIKSKNDFDRCCISRFIIRRPRYHNPSGAAARAESKRVGIEIKKNKCGLGEGSQATETCRGPTRSAWRRRQRWRDRRRRQPPLPSADLIRKAMDARGTAGFKRMA